MDLGAHMIFGKVSTYFLSLERVGMRMKYIFSINLYHLINC